jgi:hypothetical protein
LESALKNFLGQRHLSLVHADVSDKIGENTSLCRRLAMYRKICSFVILATGAVSMVGCTAGATASWPTEVLNTLLSVLGGTIFSALLGSIFPAV